jgi:N-acyl homoserine lactone hydrolase
MSLQVKRLSLGAMGVGMGPEWPVHGFLVTHPGGAILVDTGLGGPDQVLTDNGVVSRSVADALAEHDLTPGDIGLIINTHLHFDHCGQNAIFKHAPFYIQAAELERARREAPILADWFDFNDARYELLNGDAEILPGLSVVSTPGHTAGHQSVVVTTDNGAEVLIGDAAYKTQQYLEPPDDDDLPPGQASDPTAWRKSIDRVHALRPDRVHFCHDTAVVHS